MQRRGDGNGVRIILANVGQSLDDFTREGGWADMKSFADFFANEAKVLGGVSYFRGDDDPLSGG